MDIQRRLPVLTSDQKEQIGKAILDAQQTYLAHVNAARCLHLLFWQTLETFDVKVRKWAQQQWDMYCLAKRIQPYTKCDERVYALIHDRAEIGVHRGMFAILHSAVEELITSMMQPVAIFDPDWFVGRVSSVQMEKKPQRDRLDKWFRHPPSLPVLWEVFGEVFPSAPGNGHASEMISLEQVQIFDGYRHDAIHLNDREVREYQVNEVPDWFFKIGIGAGRQVRQCLDIPPPQLTKEQAEQTFPERLLSSLFRDKGEMALEVLLAKDRSSQSNDKS